MRIAIGKWCGQHSFPEGCAEATWRRVIVRDDETTEPPAHCRLVSSHDLFEMVASLIVSLWSMNSMTRGTRGRGATGEGAYSVHSLW